MFLPIFLTEELRSTHGTPCACRMDCFRQAKDADLQEVPEEHGPVRANKRPDGTNVIDCRQFFGDSFSCIFHSHEGRIQQTRNIGVARAV